MSTFSVMLISITVQNSVLDSAGMLGMNSSRIASLSRQYPLQCRGCRSCHGVQAAVVLTLRVWNPLTALQKEHHIMLWWLTLVLHMPGYSCCRIQRCGLTPPARDLYSLFASMKLPCESEFFSASFPTQAGSQRGPPREHTVPFLGHATTCHILKDKAGENKTITLRSSKDWPPPEPL